ncbi:unnamed protein product, partial [Durusdinium trenchii]
MLQAALQAEVQANDNEVTEEATVEPKEEMTMELKEGGGTGGDDEDSNQAVMQAEDAQDTPK